MQCSRRAFFYHSFLVSLIVLGNLSLAHGHTGIYTMKQTVWYSSTAVALMSMALSLQSSPLPSVLLVVLCKGDY